MRMAEVLRCEIDEGVATLTLNRPEARNALSAELRAALAERFTAFADDPAVGAIVLAGAGPTFCAGLDLKELGAGGPGRAIGDGADVIAAMEGVGRPIVGAIHGAAITGGFELALACDVLVGSPEARFADTHARVGILPGWGLSQKLPRWIGPVRAKALAFTGNFVSAQEAERWGLLLRVVPAEELLPTCTALARDMLSCVPSALRGYKALIDDGLALPYGEARRLEAERSRAHARSVRPDEIAARRAGIQARGRAQSGGGSGERA
jgi:enoyl-CoA hydratase